MEQTTQPNKQSRSYIYRKDYRSDEECEEDILTWTEKENVWADIVVIELNSLGYSSSVEDYGIDGSGKIIYNAPIKDFKKQDKKLTIDGQEFLTEFKTCDQYGKDFNELPCMTIKLHYIETCIESKNGRIAICDEKFWALIRPKCAEKILETFEPKYHAYFIEREHNKPKKEDKHYYKKSIKIPSWYIKSKRYTIFKDRKLFYGNQDDRKLEIRRWGNRAKMVINKYHKKLFRPRKGNN